MNKNKGSHYRFNGFRHRKGFSIIEIISAIVVLSILATISVNLMSDYKVRQNISSARQQVMNAMTSALAAATRDNLPYAIVFNSNHQVKVCDFDDGSGSANACNDTYVTPFEHDLAMFSKPVLVVGGNQITLDNNSKNPYLSYTPFGKIVVSRDDFGDPVDGFYTMYLRDAQNQLGVQGLCIGIRFNTNGYVESIEKAANEGNC